VRTLTDKADVDLVILALAILSLDRPGWEEACRIAAGKASGAVYREDTARHSFNEFRRLNEDRWKARPPAPVLP
jgi:hypothetical protein